MDIAPLLLGESWYTDRPGGLNRYFSDLLRALPTASVHPQGVVLAPASGAPTNVACGGQREDPILQRLWKHYRAASFAGARATLVDAHFALFAIAPTLIGPLRKLPLVVHFQGPWAQESMVQGGTSRWSVAAKRRIEKIVYRKAKQIVVLSGAFKRLLVEDYQISPWKVQVVAPGVDLAHFHPGDRRAARELLDMPENVAIVVAVRRLVPRMGLDVLLEAWALVHTTIPEAVLAIAGEGPARGDLTTQATRLGISSSVRFLGRVAEDTLVQVYQAADFAVIPTTVLEGFGLTVIEALACGTPVVATDAGSLPEVLSGLDPNLIVPAGDPLALAARLSSLIENGDAAPDAETCRRYAEQFNWEATALRHRDIYQEALLPSAPKLRVVYLDHCARLSGGELALLRMLPAMESVDPHVILAEDGPLVTRLLQAGISVEVMEMRKDAREMPRKAVGPRTLLNLRALSVVWYTVRLARRLRQLEPDLVHTNSLKAALYGGVAARLAGIPVVWHIRDRVAGDYLPAAAVRLVKAASRIVPSGVIANSQSTSDTLGATGRIQVVIPSPVDPAFAASAGHATRVIGSETVRVGIIGRIAPWKGQALFLEAFARAFPNDRTEAVIIGSPLFGEDSYEETLHSLVRQNGLDGRVEFRGFREDVAAELARLDVVVHASTSPEPFGLVVAEAMAFGLPVIAAASGGPAEMIEDGVSGLLYPMGDVTALSDTLTRLVPDRGLRTSLGVEAQSRTLKFLPPYVAEQVIHTYTQVLQGDVGVDAFLS